MPAIITHSCPFYRLIRQPRFPRFIPISAFVVIRREIVVVVVVVVLVVDTRTRSERPAATNVPRSYLLCSRNYVKPALKRASLTGSLNNSTDYAAASNDMFVIYIKLVCVSSERYYNSESVEMSIDEKVRR